MENTVTMSIKEYQELKEFKKNTEEGKIRVIHRRIGYGFLSSSSTESYLTDSEVVEQFEKENSSLIAEVYSLKQEVNKKDVLIKSHSIMTHTFPKLKDIGKITWIEFFNYKFNK